MVRLWHIFTDLFLSLTGRDPQDVQKRKQLREIQRDLRKHAPPLYRPSRNEVLPGLARSLHAFHQAFVPVRGIITRSVDHDDPRLRQRFWDSLIDAKLSDDELRIKRAFALEEMRRRILGSSEPTEEMDRIGREFRRFKAFITSEAMRPTENELRAFRKLVGLSRFPFLHLLMLFDGALVSSSASRKPQFQPVSGERICTDLMDLVFLLNGFAFDQAFERQLAFLAERIGGLVRSTAGKIPPSLHRMEKLFRTELAPPVLTNLIRAIRGDPAYIPERDRETSDFLASYAGRLEKGFLRNREILLRELHESAVEREISALFGESGLPELQGYNDEENRSLADGGHAVFAHVRPLQILKSFLAVKFERDLKDVLQRVIVEGFFESRSYQSSFSAACYAVGQSLERIRRFEEGLLGQSRVSLTGIRRLSKLSSRGGSGEGGVDGLVESVNALAAEIMEQETNRIAELGSYILEIVNDFKTKTPQNVTNIRTIGGTANRELVACMAERYNDIVRLMRIMKHFTVVRPRRGAPSSP